MPVCGLLPAAALLSLLVVSLPGQPELVSGSSARGFVLGDVEKSVLGGVEGPVVGEVEGPIATLAFVGDVMLGRGVAQALDGNWEGAFADVRVWLSGADVAFANLESPLTTVPRAGDGHDLRAPPEAVAALQLAGFDVVSLANNHALDAGRAGLAQTGTVLENAGIVWLADGELEKLGTRWPTDVASDAAPSWRQLAGSPALVFLALDDSVVPLDLAVMADTVAAAAEEADLVVVSVHWGGEYQAAPSSRQQAIAEALAAAGAGLIVGHGPHVPQRVAWVGEALVAYSLGNFLFDQPYPADCRWGAILRITLQGNHIVAVEVLPTVARRGRAGPADGPEAAAILARLGPEPRQQF